MSKSVYLIVSDLHCTYKNLDNRYNYMREVYKVWLEIFKNGNKYKDLGYEVNFIFLGDIVHNSFKDFSEAISLNNMFVILRQQFNKVYSVVGNHEFTYYKDNPFWTLMSTLKSNKVKSMLNKSWQPMGMINLIEVVDELEVGDIVFHFNHYGTKINPPKRGKRNIGLFHQDVTAKAIFNEMTINYGLDVFEGNPILFDETDVFYGYDIVFIGHNHKLYGKWNYTDDRTGYKTIIYHLASLGRTNHTEVMDTFLERNIPAIIMEDNKFVRIEDNLFLLDSREESVNIQLVEEKQVMYREKKELEERINNMTTHERPLDNVLKAFEDSIQTQQVIKDLLNNERAEYENEIISDAFSAMNRI